MASDIKEYQKYYEQYPDQHYLTIPFERYVGLTKVFRDIPDDGDIAELGVGYGGTTCLLSDRFVDKTIYAFDTFKGFKPLPKKYTKNESPRWKDWGTDTIYWSIVEDTLSMLKNVIMKKGIFPETAKDVNTKFSLVHLDVDIYLSTLYGLEFFFDKIVPGGFIVIDDLFSENYKGSSFPQVRRAVEDFYKNKNQDYRDFIDFQDDIGQGVIKFDYIN